MHTPTAVSLLDAWERGLSATPVRRALYLLAAADPETGIDALARLPIGRRDARLLQLRERLFGPEVNAVAACPACGEPLEAQFRLDDVAPPADTAPDASQVAQVGAYRIAFRLPTSDDLVALDKTPAARTALLERCVLDLRDTAGAAVDPATLPDELVTEIAARMAAVDPHADIALQMACPACSCRWGAGFDIAHFLWKEVHAWAGRTLRDVHGLARAYGWREADVLALSPTRRQIYMELARQ